MTVPLEDITCPECAVRPRASTPRTTSQRGALAWILAPACLECLDVAGVRHDHGLPPLNAWTELRVLPPHLPAGTRVWNSRRLTGRLGLVLDPLGTVATIAYEADAGEHALTGYRPPTLAEIGEALAQLPDVITARGPFVLLCAPMTERLPQPAQAVMLTQATVTPAGGAGPRLHKP